MYASSGRTRRTKSQFEGELGPLLCEPGPSGAASITVSASLSSVDVARQGLAVLAYALFDPVARTRAPEPQRAGTGQQPFV